MPLILKPIPEYGDYWISNRGQIFSMKDGKCIEMKQFDRYKVSGPRMTIVLRKPGQRKTFKVHYLVITTFGKSKKDGDYLIRHLDGNYKHNWLDNLEWGTDQSNADDTKRYNNLEEDTNWI